MSKTNKASRKDWRLDSETLKQTLFLLGTRKACAIAKLAHDRLVHAEIEAAHHEVFGNVWSV